MQIEIGLMVAVAASGGLLGWCIVASLLKSTLGLAALSLLPEFWVVVGLGVLAATLPGSLLLTYFDSSFYLTVLSLALLGVSDIFGKRAYG